ncbi:MAG: ATP-dependent DNA helicase [Candidatus Nanopelagicales bacterium]
MTSPDAHVRAGPWDAAQRQVIDHSGGPLLYLGAPGTGTTTALAAAIADSVRRYGPAQVLALTTGRSALARLRATVGSFLETGVLPVITSPHGLALTIVRDFGSVDERDEGEAQVRLLSGAEEDLRIRDLILGSVDDRSVIWPSEFTAALSTVGFANEVRRFLSSYRIGGDREQPVHVGDRLAPTEQQLLRALQQLAEIERQTASLENVVDYSGLIELAESIARRDEVRSILHQRYQAVYVDDYQDLDLLQGRLLDAVVGPTTTFVVVADPAKQILAFRGSDVRVIADFIDQRFRADDLDEHILDGHIVVAPQVYRGGTHLQTAVRRLLRTASSPGLPTRYLQQLRAPAARDVEGLDSELVVRAYAHESDLLAHVAEDIRACHIDQGVPWSQIAIITRRTASIAQARRVLESRDIPVIAVADDLPLPMEPAVAQLLAALRAAVAPDQLTETQVADLVSGPFGATDPAMQRQLARAWREQLRAAEPDHVPAAFNALQRTALIGLIEGESSGLLAGPPAGLDDLPAARQLRQVGEALGAARALVLQGASPVEVLWHLWNNAVANSDGVAWPQRLYRAAQSGHRASDHDLDAIVALFATAARLTERNSGVVGTLSFITAIEGQRIAAESIGARRGRRAEGVSIMTAHQARGQQWHTVFVLDALEGRWPDLSMSSGLLGVDDLLDPTAVRDLPSQRGEALEAERRLMVMALTRARETTVVATVDAGASGGERPSRFIADMDITTDDRPTHPPRPRTMAGLVAQLRSTLIDDDVASDERTHAAEQLAALARQTDDTGRLLVPAAHPDNWWHVLPVSQGLAPINAPDAPVRMSASGLESLTTCPLRWFLDRHARASEPVTTAAPIGQLVHVLAEALAQGEVAPDMAAMDAWLDDVWPHLGISVPWYSIAKRRSVREALERLGYYHREHADTLSHSEVAIRATIDLDVLAAMVSPGVVGQSGEDRASTEYQSDQLAVNGRIDRLEISPDGDWHIVDFKTSAKALTGQAVHEHLQLGLYQAAVLTGALTEELGADSEASSSAGASLVHLSVDSGKNDPSPKQVSQPPLTQHSDPGFLLESLSDAVRVIRNENFTARPGGHCSSCDFARMCPAQSKGQVLT